MELVELFKDKRVQRGTHIVMRPDGVKNKQFSGYQIPPKKLADGSPAYEIFPIKEKAGLEMLGWVQMKPVAEPKAAATPKAKKPAEDVE